MRKDFRIFRKSSCADLRMGAQLCLVVAAAVLGGRGNRNSPLSPALSPGTGRGS
jgi:hypothetical protein